MSKLSALQQSRILEAQDYASQVLDAPPSDVPVRYWTSDEELIGRRLYLVLHAVKGQAHLRIAMTISPRGLVRRHSEVLTHDPVPAALRE